MATKNAVRRYMVANIGRCTDRTTGEASLTQMAEEAAFHFDCSEWLDDESHWVWDLAIEVAERCGVCP